jgi:hypothetical protein
MRSRACAISIGVAATSKMFILKKFQRKETDKNRSILRPENKFHEKRMV